MLIFLVILSFIFLLWSLYMLKKSVRNKSNALIIIPTKMSFKILIITISVVAVIVNYPQSIYFLAFFISFILASFSVDIIVVDEGIGYGAKFITWMEIDKIFTSSTYFTIQKKEELTNKRFIRLVWAVNSGSLKKIEKLMEGKQGEEPGRP